MKVIKQFLIQVKVSGYLILKQGRGPKHFRKFRLKKLSFKFFPWSIISSIFLILKIFLWKLLLPSFLALKLTFNFLLSWQAVLKCCKNAHKLYRVIGGNARIKQNIVNFVKATQWLFRVFWVSYSKNLRLILLIKCWLIIDKDWNPSSKWNKMNYKVLRKEKKNQN